MTISKIVIDTCVIESAVRSTQGASFQILNRINSGQFHFGISVALFLEYEYRLRNLKSNGIIDLSDKGINSILSALAYFGNPVPIYYKIRPNLKDENDNMVFECCANYGADYLVTHNIKDFVRGDLRRYHFDIITPQYFLKEVLI